MSGSPLPRDHRFAYSACANFIGACRAWFTCSHTFTHAPTRTGIQRRPPACFLVGAHQSTDAITRLGAQEYTRPPPLAAGRTFHHGKVSLVHTLSRTHSLMHRCPLRYSITAFRSDVTSTFSRRFVYYVLTSAPASLLALIPCSLCCYAQAFTISLYTHRLRSSIRTCVALCALHHMPKPSRFLVRSFRLA